MKFEKTSSNEVKSITFTVKTNKRIDALKEFIKHIENAKTLIFSDTDDGILPGLI